MRRFILLSTVAAALVLPAAAHAEYYFTKTGAARVARDFVSRHYADTPYSTVRASCFAQSISDPDYRHYKYHRWVCGWGDFDGCSGVVRIIGHTGRGRYGALILRGARC